MRILVVDDSQTQIQNLTRQLESLGHRVVGQARDGATAVRLYEKLRPDAVFLDIVMPELDGLSALRCIRSQDPAARVIIVSSVAAIGGKVEEALRLGAAGVLAKPVTEKELSAALAKIESSNT